MIIWHKYYAYTVIEQKLSVFADYKITSEYALIYQKKIYIFCIVYFDTIKCCYFKEENEQEINFISV